LTEIKRKDVKHGAKLRTLFKQKDKENAIRKLKDEEEQLADEIKEEVDNVDQQIGEKMRELKTQHNKDIITDFLKYCRITAGDSSILKIQGKIILITDTIKKDLDKLTLEDIRDFLTLLNKSSKAIATKNDIKKTLKRFLRWKYTDWSSRFNQLSDAKCNTKQEGRSLVKGDLLTPEEMKFIINSVDSLKYKTILLLMQETANRPEELLKVKWKDINFNTKEIKFSSSKTGESRTIPINESINHLERYKIECFAEPPRNDDFVFPSSNSKKGYLSVQGLNDFLNKTEHKIEFKKHLYPYLWRHSILSRMIKTLSPKVYEMYAGHSLEMGMKTYSHLDNEDLKEELFKKVYHIEELTKGEQNKIKKLESEMKLLQGGFALQTEAIKILISANNQRNLLSLPKKQQEVILSMVENAKRIIK
jgi:integrase